MTPAARQLWPILWLCFGFAAQSQPALPGTPGPTIPGTVPANGPAVVQIPRAATPLAPAPVPGVQFLSLEAGTGRIVSARRTVRAGT